MAQMTSIGAHEVLIAHDTSHMVDECSRDYRHKFFPKFRHGPWCFSYFDNMDRELVLMYKSPLYVGHREPLYLPFRTKTFTIAVLATR